MQKITMFILTNCPYCRQAARYIEKLYESDERYRGIPIETIDEARHPDIANRYDYYYVPTLYVGEKKEFEGAPGFQDIKRVFDEALK